jgi:hypothetical protein
MAEAPEKAEKAKPPTKNEQIALAILDRAIKEANTLATVGPGHEERPVTLIAGWRDRYYAEAQPGETQSTKRQAFRRATEGLMAQGRVATQDGFVWRPEVW